MSDSAIRPSRSPSPTPRRNEPRTAPTPDSRLTGVAVACSSRSASRASSAFGTENVSISNGVEEETSKGRDVSVVVMSPSPIVVQRPSWIRSCSPRTIIVSSRRWGSAFAIVCGVRTTREGPAAMRRTRTGPRS